MSISFPWYLFFLVLLFLINLKYYAVQTVVYFYSCYVDVHVKVPQDQFTFPSSLHYKIIHSIGNSYPLHYSACLLAVAGWCRVRVKSLCLTVKNVTYSYNVRHVTSIIKVRKMPWHVNSLPCTVRFSRHNTIKGLVVFWLLLNLISYSWRWSQV